MTDTARDLSWSAYDTEESGSIAASALAAAYGKSNLIEDLDGKAASKILNGGTGGISFTGTAYDDDTSLLVLSATYSVTLPPGLGWFESINITQTRTLREWTGFSGRSSTDGTLSDDLIYVTNYGTVYHRDLSCRYLDLSIEKCSLSEIDTLRNSSGGKYYPCEKCWDGGSETVYITDSGTRYHQTLGCPSLIRSVKTMLLTEAVSAGYDPCSYCGGG